MKKAKERIIIAALFVLIAAAVAAWFYVSANGGIRGVFSMLFSSKTETWPECTVRYVYDGDTIEVEKDGQTQRIRLLGINAPEVAHAQDGSVAEFYGDEAKAQLCKLLPVGTAVRLEYEGRDHDKYGRTLAYIWKDDQLINLRLVELGCAKTLFYRDAENRKAAFARAESDATRQRLGLWAKH